MKPRGSCSVRPVAVGLPIPSARGSSTRCRSTLWRECYRDDGHADSGVKEENDEEEEGALKKKKKTRSPDAPERKGPRDPRDPDPDGHSRHQGKVLTDIFGMALQATMK